ncbi:MAG: CoA transferase [Myxococcota bacterium]|nr:CoA transferase [Myxococcota bacterium]
MLTPYRVVDFSDEQGLLCGQILADLGADVIRIEPPGGSTARRVGPFAGDQPGLERSLYWWAYARNTRSVVLDAEASGDRDALLALVAGADFLIESARPGRMAELGLGYPELAALNPGLVYVSISPFGQTGPKADWLASDLVSMAAGGHAFLTGETDGPPLRVSVPQAHGHAATDAAVGALVAHFARRQTGRGQHVDISAQQSVTLATMFRSLDAPLEEAPARRISGGVYLGGNWVSSRYALRDGSVVVGPAWLPSTGHFMKRLMDWAEELGFCDDPGLLAEDWSTYALRMMRREIGAEEHASLDAVLTELFASLGKRELMQAVVERRLLLAPVLSLGEVIESEQLKARDFSVPLAVSLAGPAGPAGGEEGEEGETGEKGETVEYPGPVAHFSRTPIEYRLPPPRLDEHRAAILSEPVRSPASASPNPDSAFDPNRPGPAPLEGIKILDLFWILAGPGSTRMLADYGATVVHVESGKHLDTLRVIPPYRFNNPHPEGAGGFQSVNANKLDLSLDIHSPEGLAVVMELVEWADVVTESFAPGVAASLGLEYAALAKMKSDLIMISSSLMGQTGPWKSFSGFGNLAASVTGYLGHAGWPDRLPSGPHGAYTDFISARYNAVAILAALEYRERTGEGQYIDQSQAEAALHFLAPAFVDYTFNGKLREQVGNSDTEQSPHGVYPCAGEDRWIAIAIASDAQYRGLCSAMDRPDLLARRGEGPALDPEIAAWTAEYEGEKLEALLQAHGVPAHRTLDTLDLYACPQMQHREHYIDVACDIYQSTTVESSRLRLSESRPRRPEKAVSLGRDNRYVLETILGYSPERIAGLAEAGILL